MFYLIEAKFLFENLFAGLKKRGGPVEGENSERRITNSSSDQGMSRKLVPPFEGIDPTITHSFVAWTQQQFETKPPSISIFQMITDEDFQQEKVKIFGLYESMLMNFVETVAETEIPHFLIQSLQVQVHTCAK